MAHLKLGSFMRWLNLSFFGFSVLAHSACTSGLTLHGSEGDGDLVPDTIDTDVLDTDFADTDPTDGAVVPVGQPPVRVTLTVHGHNYGFTEQQAQAPAWEQTKNIRYELDKAEIQWVADLAEWEDSTANLQLNGEFCADALRLGDTDWLVDLEQRGHMMGSHFHMYRATGINHFWAPVSTATATEQTLREIFSDHVTACEQVFGEPVYRVDPAINSPLVDEDVLVPDLTAAKGVMAEPAGEAFSYTDWNHNPLTAFRRQVGTKLLEDPTRPVVGVSSMGQVGQLEPAGKHMLMASGAQLKRQFLVLLAQRRAAERAGEPPRVWQFGIMTHPFENAQYRDEIEDLVFWLADFQADGLVEFVSDGELVDAVEDFEAQYPGVSSFSFDLDAWLAGDEVAYPYGAEGFTRALLDAEVVGELDIPGVHAFELNHRAVLRGPRNEEGVRSVAVGAPDAHLIALWPRDAGTTVDLTPWLGDSAVVMTAVDGTLNTVDPSSLSVPPLGVVVTDDSSIWEAR